MTTARSELIDIEATPYYHTMARCVRRAYLCGQDELTGRNFDHRKTWVVERIKFLASIFAIDVCAYAVLSNHLHLILRVLAHLAAQWSDEEVVERARLLCPTRGEGFESWPKDQRQQFIEIWRGRLSNVSWFMAQLDEYIARRANKEDECTGRFWEGRFKSNALMDDGALLTAMSYVDLNPVRAGIAAGLDDSSWTSIQQRLREAAAARGVAPAASSTPREQSQEPSVEPAPGPTLEQCPTLAPMEGEKENVSDCLPVSLLQYIALLEWTGRSVRDDKSGVITSGPTELLTAFGLDPEGWLDSVNRFGCAGGFVGHPRRLKQRAAQIDRRWLRGQGSPTTAYALAA